MKKPAIEIDGELNRVMRNGDYNIIDHPVIWDKMTKLRNKDTGTKEFRELVEEVSTLIGYEALREALTTEVTIETPLTTMIGRILENDFCVVPIYRAGLGMEAGIMNLLPNAKVGHIGIYRDPESHEPQTYYKKFPKDIGDRIVLLLDPMLATGGTASESIHLLKQAGANEIIFLCLVSCRTGALKLLKDHPDVPIYTASHDDRLDENAYIVPGLGDAGDRIFGTK